MKKLLIIGTAAVCISGAAFADAAYTSANYVQDGLVAQWDGIDNATVNDNRTHDASATVWKDLIGSLDLTLTANGSWSANGNALVANGIAAKCATAAPDYKTIEVVYKRTNNDGRALFSGGAVNQFVVFDNAGGGSNDVYFAGVSGTPMRRSAFNASEICFASAQYDDTGATSGLYMDSESVTTSPKYNTWYASEGISVGGRYHSSYGAYAWYGEVYAIRLYNRRLTAYEMAHNYRVDCKRFLTATSYVQDGLLAHWDGIDNAGIGVHDSSSTTWKNISPNRLTLAEDGLDLTLGSTGSWGETYLYCDGSSNNSKPAAYGSTNFTFNAFETVYENKATSGKSAILFSAGNLGSSNSSRRYCCIGNGYVGWTDSNNDSSKAFDGQRVPGMNSLSWSYSGYAYANGASIAITSGFSGGWGLGNETRVLVGCRNDGNAYPFKGNIHAIRAYSGTLSAGQVAFNYKVDEVRFFNTLVWNGSGASVGDGDFVTPGGWRIPANERVTRAVPGVGDTAVFSSGDYTVTLSAPWTLGGLELGAGVSMALPMPSGEYDATKPLLAVAGSVSADATSSVSIEVEAFNKNHRGGSSVNLIVCGVDSAAALQCLADSVKAAHKGCSCKVVNGTRLVYRSPSGFVISFR
ncbi:MAG: hypothetical protein IJH50_01255 [Kiritimatiellae bacterium]|nr:hypothetical protein [Kiritimatiellia bacterium]